MTASTREIYDFYAGDSFAYGHNLTRKVPAENGRKLERHYVFHVATPHFVVDRVDAGGDISLTSTSPVPATGIGTSS